MKSNRELYKATFSKLHATEKPDTEPLFRKPVKYSRPAVTCLAVICILMIAATVSYAMTGEGPVRFFRSFFQNSSLSVSQELGSSYVAVTDQSLTYENMNIMLEGYSYTGDTLMAKIRITQSDESGPEIKDHIRRLRFASLSAAAASVEWEQGEDGATVAAVRMNLEGTEGVHEKAGEADIIVWDQNLGINDRIGTLAVDNPAEVSGIVLENVDIPGCRRIVITGLNIKIYFDPSVTEEEECPLQKLTLKMKDGTGFILYDRKNGSEADDIVSGVSFSWHEERESTLVINFSQLLEIKEIQTISVNGKELQ